MEIKCDHCGVVAETIMPETVKDVEKLLKLDPSNTELVRQKQQLLAQAIKDIKEKLATLKTAAEQANEQLQKGEITQQQYDALQREDLATTSDITSSLLLQNIKMGENKMLTDQQLKTCREMDLLTYLSLREPRNLVRLSDQEYCTEEHDSLKISNGKWMWWSQGIGGKTAVDYLNKVKGMSFMEAALEVLSASKGYMTMPIKIAKPKERQREKHLILPERAPTNRQAYLYLTSRCIEPVIIKECIDLDLIYEDIPGHNVIFLGKDPAGNNRYACYRSTGEKKNVGECCGSDKRFSFRLGDEKSTKLHVFESAIDLLSYATLVYLSGGDYHKFDLLSLGGVFARSKDDRPYKLPKALDYYLETHPFVDTVYLHLDMDRAGWQAAKGIKTLLEPKLKVIDNPPPYGKDVNDFLCLRPLD